MTDLEACKIDWNNGERIRDELQRKEYWQVCAQQECKGYSNGQLDAVNWNQRKDATGIDCGNRMRYAETP